MKKVLITGATSGIGLAISKKMLDMGYSVYGVGRDFSKIDIASSNFYPIICDLIKYQNIEDMIKKLKKEVDIDILINCAGVGYFGPHEEINPTKLHKMIALNLEAPLILTQLLLRDLKKRKGTVINISSITATKASTYGCAYSATKAGLVHFSKGLDITKTPFYDELNFREGEEEESYILPECVADAVENILSQREGTVITEIILQPQKHIIRKK